MTPAPLRALRVRGSFRGTSGYDRHTRAFVRAFAAAGTAIELAPCAEWGSRPLPSADQDPWFEDLAAPVDAPLTLHFTLPTQVVPDPGRVNVNYTMFEAGRVPDAWAAAAAWVDRVVVPTESSRAAWLAAGVPADRLRVSPLGVDVDTFARPAEPLRLVADDGEELLRRRTRFLAVAELDPRKNLEGLIAAWLRATTPADDAVLFLKLSALEPLRFERLWARVRAAMLAAGREWTDAAPVHVIRHVFPDAAMPRLYASATHYISLSFGEGWDLPMSEAAASGLRLIAPDHSAYRAYLDDAVARFVRAHPVATSWTDDTTWHAGLFAGSQWWAPDEGDAVRAIREAIDGTEAMRADPRVRMRAFSWAAAAERLREVLDEALADARGAAPGG